MVSFMRLSFDRKRGSARCAGGKTGHYPLPEPPCQPRWMCGCETGREHNHLWERGLSRDLTRSGSKPGERGPSEITGLPRFTPAVQAIVWMRSRDKPCPYRCCLFNKDPPG